MPVVSGVHACLRKANKLPSLRNRDCSISYRSSSIDLSGFNPDCMRSCDLSDIIVDRLRLLPLLLPFDAELLLLLDVMVS